MSENQNPIDEPAMRQNEDEVEGHRFVLAAHEENEDDDVEGHRVQVSGALDPDIDVRSIKTIE